MKRQLLATLIVASFATTAFNAIAQNATPRELSPGTATTSTAQNGSPVGTTTQTPGMNMAPIGADSQAAKARMTSEQMREYADARNACSTKGTQMETCNNDVNRKFSSVDAKCQKLSGGALADCLKGADHGS